PGGTPRTAPCSGTGHTPADPSPRVRQRRCSPVSRHSSSAFIFHALQPSCTPRSPRQRASSDGATNTSTSDVASNAALATTTSPRRFAASTTNATRCRIASTIRQRDRAPLVRASSGPTMRAARQREYTAHISATATHRVGANNTYASDVSVMRAPCYAGSEPTRMSTPGVELRFERLAMRGRHISLVAGALWPLEPPAAFFDDDGRRVLRRAHGGFALEVAHTRPLPRIAVDRDGAAA